MEHRSGRLPTSDTIIYLICGVNQNAKISKYLPDLGHGLGQKQRALYFYSVCHGSWASPVSHCLVGGFWCLWSYEKRDAFVQMRQYIMIEKKSFVLGKFYETIARLKLSLRWQINVCFISSFETHLWTVDTVDPAPRWVLFQCIGPRIAPWRAAECCIWTVLCNKVLEKHL